MELNKNERIIATIIGKERYASNRKNGIVNQKAGTMSIYETEVEGVGGELAFAKMCNLYPDFSVVPGKYDFVAHGMTVDVKTTKHKNGRLLVSSTKKISDCDSYVLVVGSMPRYEIIGWAYAPEIINEEHLGTLGNGPVYMMDQSELHSFPDNLFKPWEKK
tara:strand:+ start:900 stop:1382 length:483 start_codon:yes stop_codon:yes gene_type:complete